MKHCWRIPHEEARRVLHKMASEGATYEEMGAALGCTRQNVEQRIHRLGLYAFHRDVRSQIELGCSVREYEQLTKGLGSKPKTAYHSQKNGAKERCIEWQFTFPTWWAVWTASGKWSERGRGANGYCMARYADAGPYSPDNVRITTNRDNMIENGWVRLPSRRGVSVERRVKSRPYFVRVRGEVVGRYATQVEAQAAYKIAVKESLDTRIPFR